MNNQNNLLDKTIEKLNLKNDAALSRALGVAPPVISKLRHEKLKVGVSIMARIHDETDWTFKQMREMAGLPAHVRGA